MVSPIDRVILIVLDSVGAGEAPDAAAYGDQGAATLSHIADAVGGLALPHLGALGLGSITPIRGVPPAERATGAFGKMQEVSHGKDTTTGHWEMMGVIVETPFATFPQGFPEEILAPFIARTGRGVLGNKVASGTEILVELGEKHLQSGDWIVYTSADSVFQIAAHEEKVPLEELYRACEIAREILDEHQVGRVIARPFVGKVGAFSRTYNRRDFSMQPTGRMVLDALKEASVPVAAIGKIEDIYAGRGISRSVHTEGNADGIAKIIEELSISKQGFLFANLVDFDMLYGHRSDPAGYARCLESFDLALPAILEQLGPNDLLLLSADHGNDPTDQSTDHSREFVPVLAYGPGLKAGVNLGTRGSFADLGATIADALQVPWNGPGESFLPALR
jgi:phosphopentomutase